MKKAWDWVKRWGAFLFAGLLVLMGAGWLWRRRTAELGRVQNELAVARAQKEIARLQGQRDEVALRVGEKDEKVEEIDKQLAANRRKIVEAHEHGQGLSDEEVEVAFARLGY